MAPSEPDLHEAVRIVEQLKLRAVSHAWVPGLSGSTRALGGAIAIAAAATFSSSQWGRSGLADWQGWVAVAGIVFAINAFALWRWFLREDGGKGELCRVAPLLDALPPLFVGVLITLTLVRLGGQQVLPSLWMAIFGLVNLAGRRALPAATVMVGWFYLCAGTAGITLVPEACTAAPWWMGAVFGTGELWGGAILLAAHGDIERGDDYS